MVNNGRKQIGIDDCSLFAIGNWISLAKNPAGKFWPIKDEVAFGKMN